MTRPEPVLILRRRQYAAHPAVWLRARKKGIGASDAAAVLGMHPWASPLSLYVDKRTPHVTQEETEAMVWGRVLEGPVAEEMAKRHGKKLAPCPGLMARPGVPWQQCTVDRMVRGEDVPLEVKTTSAFKADEWPKDGAPPDHVVIQLHHQFMVGGWEYGYVAALVGGNSPRWCRIDRNPLLINALEEAEPVFWDQVMTGRPPDPIGHDADLPALALIYAGEKDRELVADDHLTSLFAVRQRAKAMAGRGERDQRVVDARILAAMGDATRAVDEDGERLFTVVHVGATRIFDQKQFRVAEPDYWNKYQRDRRPYAFVLPAKAKPIQEEKVSHAHEPTG